MKKADVEYIQEQVKEIMARHRVSRETGFLAPNPLPLIPRGFGWIDEYFEGLDKIVYNLPEHIKNGTVYQRMREMKFYSDRLGNFPQQYPYHDEKQHFNFLSWEGQNRFMFVLQMIIHAYFNETLKYKNVGELRRDTTLKYLPPIFSINSWRFSQLTGFAPTLSYGLYALWNWRKKDRDRPLALDNIDLLHSFTDTTDEKWFVWIHQMIEKEFAPAIPALLEAALLVSLLTPERDITRRLTKCLETVSKTFENTLVILNRMREHCDFKTYFSNIRLFYMFPQNVVFVGVPELQYQAQNFYGETGGQTPFKHFLRASLGFYPTKDSYFPSMRQYMSKYFRELIELTLQSSHIRDYVILRKKNRNLVNAYNAIIETDLKWQKEHISLVDDYIVRYGDSHGTGSTPLPWLQGIYDQTAQFLL